MKTSLSIFTIALMLGILFSPLRAQSNKKVIRNEAVADFSSIRLQAVGDIFFTQSDDYFLRVEGPEEYVKKVTVTVKDGKLVLSYKQKNNDSKKLKYYISAPDLSRVDVEGVGSFRCEKKLKLKNLELNMTGVGSINIADLECKTLRARLEGVGKVNVHVNCVNLIANADGVGHMTLSGYAKTTKITKDGIGGVNTRNLETGE